MLTKHHNKRTNKVKHVKTPQKSATRPHIEQLVIMQKYRLRSIVLTVCVPKTAEEVAKSVDSDQKPPSSASDLGLYCLLRHVCPIT